MLLGLFAQRYLFSTRSRSIVNLISGLSVVAVAMPVAAMIILLSVFNGFETLVKSMYSAFDADLTITPSRGATFDTRTVDSLLKGDHPRIAARSFVLEQSVLLEHDDNRTTATLRGVDDFYSEVFPMPDYITGGEWEVRFGDRERMSIGQSMAWQLGIHSLADSDIKVYAVRRNSFSSLLPFENYTARTLRVSGVYSVDTDTERTYVLSSLRFARELLGYENRASALLIRLCDPAHPEERPTDDFATRFAPALREELGDTFTVRTRSELRASFYRIMTYEKWGIFFISLLVLIIASFSMVGALAMLIVDKRHDISTLRALGADWGFIRSIFRTEGLLICATGALLGTVIGVGATLVQQYFGIIEIPADTFLTKSYPVVFRLWDLGAVLVSFAAIAAVLSHITVRNMIKSKL